MYRWHIYCSECSGDIDFDEELEAMDGNRSEDGDRSVLTCQPWSLPHPPDSQKFLCDECGTAVCVAPSSSWFIEQHKQEREEFDQSR